MIEDTRTITVVGFTGQDVEKTKAQFVEIWKGQAMELYSLDWSTEWRDEVLDLVDRVEQKASDRFEELYAKQNRGE